MLPRLAYKEAGITNPREQISFAEVHDCFTITNGDLRRPGLKSPGRWRKDVEEGF